MRAGRAAGGPLEPRQLPSLAIPNDKVLTVLLPLQQHPLPSGRKILHHTLPLNIPQKFFFFPFASRPPPGRFL